MSNELEDRASRIVFRIDSELFKNQLPVSTMCAIRDLIVQGFRPEGFNTPVKRGRPRKVQAEEGER